MDRGRYHPAQEGRPRSAMSLIITLRINLRVNQPNSINDTLSSPSLSKLQNHSYNTDNFGKKTQKKNKKQKPSNVLIFSNDNEKGKLREKVGYRKEDKDYSI